MRTEQPTKNAGKAAARRKERAAALALSPTALADAKARASAVEAELFAMLDPEERGFAARAEGRSGSAKSKTGGKARFKGGKR